jgi:hypothetical protein
VARAYAPPWPDWPVRGRNGFTHGRGGPDLPHCRHGSGISRALSTNGLQGFSSRASQAGPLNGTRPSANGIHARPGGTARSERVSAWASPRALWKGVTRSGSRIDPWHMDSGVTNVRRRQRSRDKEIGETNIMETHKNTTFPCPPRVAQSNQAPQGPTVPSSPGNEFSTRAGQEARGRVEERPVWKPARGHKSCRSSGCCRDI